MKNFITNLLIVVVLVGTIGYIGYNVKKANPDFTLVPEIITEKQNEAKREELEKTIKFEETNVKDMNLEKINPEEIIAEEDYVDDMERGKASVRNTIKYLKYVDLYEDELYKDIVTSYEKNVKVFHTYNELYNADLIANDIVGKIEVEMEISNERDTILGLWNFTAKVPLSNNTVKIMKGRTLLDENHEWTFDADGNDFRNAVAETYKNSRVVSIKEQENVAKMFEKSMRGIIKLVRDKKDYTKLGMYFSYQRTGFIESDETYKKAYDELSKIVNNNDFELVSVTLKPNQVIPKTALKVQSGKEAYEYRVEVNYTTKYKGIESRWTRRVNVNEVEGIQFINNSLESSFVNDFIRYHSEE